MGTVRPASNVNGSFVFVPPDTARTTTSDSTWPFHRTRTR
jgi:hypothetical protein